MPADLTALQNASAACSAALERGRRAASLPARHQFPHVRDMLVKNRLATCARLTQRRTQQCWREALNRGQMRKDPPEDVILYSFYARTCDPSVEFCAPTASSATWRSWNTRCRCISTASGGGVALLLLPSVRRRPTPCAGRDAKLSEPFPVLAEPMATTNNAEVGTSPARAPRTGVNAKLFVEAHSFRSFEGPTASEEETIQYIVTTEGLVPIATRSTISSWNHAKRSIAVANVVLLGRPGSFYWSKEPHSA